MGIRGLTTFINNRAHLYLKDYELHDCSVVIDGNSLASNLYKWHCKSNDCFGGDYDKFANVIRNFFDQISQCNIVPYVVLDGGYEKRKLTTVVNRMKNKIIAAESLNAITEGTDSVFPLFLREVFVDIVLSLGLKVARCEFEGDMQISVIAQTLNCPVISYDSDFYIFGCLYIPFTTVDITPKKGRVKAPAKPYTYLSSKIYHIENFLEIYGGLDKNNLPLLAVLLGNDYISGTLFNPFFRNLKMQKCSSTQSDQQKRIKSVIVWLQNENVESAILKILSRFRGPRRQYILKQIESAMKGYNQASPELLKHLGIEPSKHNSILDIDFKNISLNDDSVGEVDETEDSEDAVLEDSLESDEVDFAEKNSNELTLMFKQKYRKCQYPACFMDMITLRKYYCVPQVEDSSLEHSHVISLEIVRTIFDILCPSSTKGISIVFRSGKRRIQYAVLPRILDTKLAILKDIEDSNAENRKYILLKLLSIDDKFRDIFHMFSVDWHLFLISMKYAFNNNKGRFDDALLYSCLLCFLILNFVDSKIGFQRVSKTFDKKFSQTLIEIKSKTISSEFTDFTNLDKCNCLILMEKMISYFQMDSKLRMNYRLYDKTLVHSLSELQSVFLHIKYLNALLDMPFPALEIHKIFDGTFLYNMISNLRKRSNIMEYLELLLKDCPSILKGTKQIVSVVNNFVNNTVTIKCAVKRSKKKKKKIVSEENVDEDSGIIVSDEENEGHFDPNNPYSVLTVS